MIPAVWTDERVKLEEDFDVALEKLMKECDRSNAENVCFIYYPYGDVGGESTPDIAMVNYIQDRVEGKGYRFLNLVKTRNDFGLDYQRDYWNAGHFNIYGAEKVTAVVGEYLRTAYDLPDRRDDPDYAQWNDDMYPYHKNVKDSKASVDKAIAAAKTA